MEARDKGPSEGLDVLWALSNQHSRVKHLR